MSHTPPPVEYYSPDRSPPSPKDYWFANALWFCTGGLLTLVSLYVWWYAGEEPFYGGGDTAAQIVYCILTPVTFLAWAAWATWAIWRVRRRRLRARWLAILFWAPLCGYLMLTSLNVYLSDQGMRSEWIDWLEWRVYRLTH